MPILVFQHGPGQVPGRLGLTLRDHAKKIDLRRLDLPRSPGNPHVPPDFDGIDGVISLGGSPNVTDLDTHAAWMAPELEFLREAHKRQLPLIGICLGHQMIAAALGGEVGPMDVPEWGMIKVHQHPVANTEIMLNGIPWTMPQFSAHEQEVKTLPPGATVLQYSAACKVQSFRAGLRTYAFQYHFECDLPMIEAWAGASTDDIARTGSTTEAMLREARANYEAYARLSDRLSVNLASLMFPLMRASA